MKSIARPWMAVLLGMGISIVATSAHADWDDMERIFGASNVNGQVGNGGLTAGFASTGELTVLGWPSPSYYDQVHYQTSTDDDAREQPYFGAAANEGLFAGLYVETAEGGEMLWLRDAPFVAQQSYLNDASGVLITEHHAWDLGLTVTAESMVRIGSDVLVQRYTVVRDQLSPVLNVRFVYYENLSPCLTRDPHLPLQDWMFDAANDFGALWMDKSDAVLHFMPEAGGLEMFDELMDDDWASMVELSDTVSAVWPTMVEEAGEGVYLALGGREAPEQFQIGMDSVAGCASVTGWDYSPTDPFVDLEDGELQGSTVAGCQTTAAMLWSHDFEANPSAVTFEVILAAAATWDGARDALEDTREYSWDELQDEVDQHWGSLMTAANLPDTDDVDALAFAQRSLISILQGTDRDTTAIVASITTQPPYRQDWPRDAAFLNLALDVAGMPGVVSDHNAFLAGLQEVEDHEDLFGNVTPAGAWHMNFYADGEYGGHIPFEIDATGLLAWSLWTHVKYLDSDSARRAYLADVAPALLRAGDLLSGCVDDTYPYAGGSEQLLADVRGGSYPENDDERADRMASGDYQAFLQCGANEDDHEEIVQTLYGAHTVRLGLLAAAAGVRATCGEEARADWYEARADELAEAMVGLWANEEGDWTGRSDWVLWPHPALGIDDPRMEALAEAKLAGLQDSLGLVTDGGSYANKDTLTLARHWADDDARLAELEPLILTLSGALPTPGTRHVGEVWVALDTNNDGAYETFDNRVAVPHLWTACLTYLSIMALTDPELFDTVDEDGVGLDCSDGTVELEETMDSCECRQSDGLAGGGGVAAVLLLGVAGVVRRRARG